jgi:primosomal protein N' (replication factor Y)
VGANKPGGGASESSPITPTRAIARVVLDTRLPHLDRLLDYRIPDGMSVSRGNRVKVPLGRAQKLSTGFVVDVTQDSDYPGELSPIDDVVSEVCVLTDELWRLAREVADRQGGSAADILRLAIPQRAVRVERAWLDRAPAPFKPPPVPETSRHYSPDTWNNMIAVGSRTALELPPGILNTSTGHPTTKAADTIAALAATVLATGQSVVISVPDWRDSDLVWRSLLEYLPPDSMVRLGADQTPSERYTNYLRCLEDSPIVVIGQRHAVYQPVSQLGLLVVLSESDDSHREPLAPYPHTRDIALIRAQQTGCALVFADWVTGVDIMRLVDMDYLTLVAPMTRERPKVIPTALTVQGEQSPTPGRLPSLAYRAVSDAIVDGPVLIQVFRSGFAPGLACTSCRDRVRCEGCGGPVTASSPAARRSCRWCGVSSTPRACPGCGATAVTPIGQGVGRTVTELGKAFPTVPVIQADGDHPTLEVSDRPALVVATRGSEPVAHGGYRAVLLLDGDKMLQRSSLGALEETLRSWEWAASLAAPGTSVYVTDVEGPVVHAFAAGAHRDLMMRELRERRDLRLPPAIRIASVTGPAAIVADVTKTIVDAFPGSDVLGPIRLDEDRVRSVLRFSYSVGSDIARDLRAAVIARALSPTPAAKRLRIVLDDLAALDQISATP